MQWTANDLYGSTPSAQPTPTGVPDHAPGTPEPVARTLPRTPAGVLGSPTLVLVLLLGLALLLNFSVRLEVKG